ncbi:hypothetical protein ABEB36_003059 [Hypothenemus hampei]|uniref:Transmembrane protein 192 n=1 Tax=Hypothenemus hampei TaxID=57062 RepID=A0ABD1FB18_HYPHA
MVSLSRSYNTNYGGATFFSESVNMDDRENLLPVLESFGKFKPVPTVPLFSIHLFFTLILDILAIFFASSHPDQKSWCNEYFIIAYLHIAFWLLTCVLHFATKFFHQRVQLHGYLDFYKDIQCHGNLPFLVVSLWTVALSLVQNVMQHYYLDDFTNKCLKGGSMSPRAFLCAFITMEFCVLLGINVSYMMKVISFNRQKPPPDVLKSEWLTSGNPDTFSQNEVGYREMGSKVYDFLEKQADLIRFLKDHNAKLAEKVMTLNSQLRNETQESSGS